MSEKLVPAQLFDEKNLVSLGEYFNQKTALFSSALKRLRRYGEKGEAAALLTGEYIGENGLVICDAKKVQLKQKDGRPHISKKSVKSLNDSLVASGQAVVGCCYFCEDFADMLESAALIHRKRFRFSREVFVLFSPKSNCFCLFEWQGGDIVMSQQLYYCGKKPMSSQLILFDRTRAEFFPAEAIADGDSLNGRDKFITRLFKNIFKRK